MARKEDLTDEQWAVVSPHIPKVIEREDGRGRPRVHNDRSVLNGILWILRTAACWADMPKCFPSASTCYRRFSCWVKEGTMRKVLETLAKDLEQRGDIDLCECFIDGSFVVAKKGGRVLERPSGARVQSSWSLRTLLVFHSQSTRLLLRLMKSPLSKLPWMRPSPWDDPDALLGIVPTTLMRWIKDSRKKALI
jgi:transposase